MFAQTCLDKTQAEALVPQLEPDETGDNSSFLNVNIHSSLDQISWGSLAPTIVQQPVQQIKEANETTTSIKQEYMISAQDENGQNGVLYRKRVLPDARVRRRDYSAGLRAERTADL